MDDAAKDMAIFRVCPAKPACPPTRKVTFQSHSEWLSQFEKGCRESLGFYADLEQPGMLLQFGGGGDPENPDDIRSAREENYITMAKFAIVDYNKENIDTGFEVEHVEKAKVKSVEQLSRLSYDLVFIARAAAASTLETFEVVVRVCLGNPTVGEKFTVELCRIKSG